MASIAFIGLGNMGGPMALNLLRAGHTLHVFDLSASAVQTLVDAGAHAAASAAAAVAAADDAVISMLPASPHVKALYLGENGVLANARPGALLIDSSTIASHVAVEVAQAQILEH